MTGHARMFLFAMPLAAVLTVGGTVAILKKPWGVLKLVDTVGTSAESLAGAMTSFAPGHAPVAVSFAGGQTAGRGPEAAEDDQVDYNRLSDDMKVVAETLESFNQKLLRMIAQVKAAQQQEAEAKRLRETPEVETPPAPQENTGGATSVLSARVPAPRPPDEEETLTQ